MPKVVDHEEQRRSFAKAAIRVLCREGFEGTTTKKVADEAGLSYGSLFYYFDSKDDLILYSIRQSLEVPRAQLDEGIKKGEIGLRDLLISNLGLTEDDRETWKLWLLFYSRVPSVPAFREEYEEYVDVFVHAIRSILDRDKSASLIRADIDTEQEAVILAALCESLGQNGCMLPKRLPLEVQIQLLDYHLSTLANPQ